MKLIILFALVTLTLGQRCSKNGSPGVCMKTTSCSAWKGQSFGGLCPGAADIQCCVAAFSSTDACGNKNGVCVSATSCAERNGNTLSGFCGGSDLCCVNASPSAPTRPPTSAPTSAPTAAPTTRAPSPTPSPSPSNTRRDVDPSTPCGKAGGVCSQGCAQGGKWVSGLCSGTSVCCVGAQGDQPVKGKSYATYFLQSQAFRNQYPGALVYIPSSYDVFGPLNIVVFIHGFGNCIENSVRPVKDSKPCSPGGAVCYGFGLIEQMEAAAPQAILVLPEVAYDKRDSSPGQLGNTNGFKNFLNELLGLVSPTLGDRSTENINSIQLFSFSGAYLVASLMTSIGGVETNEIILLDSLYGQFGSFTTWIKSRTSRFGTAPKQYRFANVYGASTEGNSLNQISQVTAAWNNPAIKPFVDKTTSTLAQSTYANPLFFKKTGLPHNSIPASYVRPFVQATYGTSPPSAEEEEDQLEDVDEEYPLDFLDVSEDTPSQEEDEWAELGLPF